MKVFIDTWGWISLFNKREKRHQDVKKWYNDFRNKNGEIYTSDYILDETYTLLFRRTPFEIAAEAVKKIDASIRAGYLLLEKISIERFEKAKKMRLKYIDKPLISFTDFTSIVVMNEEHITLVLTEDDHFTYMGSGLIKVPEWE